MNTESTPLLGTRTTLAHCCRQLGLPAPLQPGQRLRWWGWDAAMNTGINAQIDRFDPESDGEPYVLSIGVYERVAVLGSAQRDGGIENQCVAVLDLAWANPAGDAYESTVDPARRPLCVATADVAPTLAERSLDELLDELRLILASWPAIREESAI